MITLTLEDRPSLGLTVLYGSQASGDGYQTGYDDGYDAGHDAGYEEGYDSGHDAGYTDGKGDGYTEGYNTATGEIEPKLDDIIDIQETLIGEEIDEGADKLTTIAENEQRVFEAGKKSEYDKFWDAYQDYGNRRNYAFAFMGHGFNTHNFFPKYDIVPEVANSLFENWHTADLHYISLKDRMAECGVRFDFSNLTDFTRLFYFNKFTELPLMDCSTATKLTASFAYNYALVTIEKLIVSEDTVFDRTFDASKVLTNLTMGGVIGQNGFNVSVCPLTHTSLMSIINALKTFTDGTTKTVTLGSTNLAKLTDAEKAIATQKGWTLA